MPKLANKYAHLIGSLFLIFTQDFNTVAQNHQRLVDVTWHHNRRTILLTLQTVWICWQLFMKNIIRSVQFSVKPAHSSSFISRPNRLIYESPRHN